MNKTPMPIISGILQLVSGCISLLIFPGLLIATIAMGSATYDPYWRYDIWESGFELAVGIVVILTVVFFIAGILSVIGGIFCIQRKKWALSLIGAIAAIIPTFALGVVSIVLTAVTKEEFE